MLKKLFKKIGKFVKRGLKKVGSFFKRAFKGVGKFIGKLGPVGMLGMMLIMPQLGSWWSQFGEWAGTLAQPFKFGMKAIHEAGSLVGKAYSTITEGIDSIVGGFADTVGLGDHYKDFKSWMDTKAENFREKIGLQTQEGFEWESTPDDIKAIGDPSNYPETVSDYNIEPVSSQRTFTESPKGVEYSVEGFEGLDTFEFKGPKDVVDFRNKMIETGTIPTTAQDEYLKQLHGGLGGEEGSLMAKPSGDKSFFDKVVDKGKKAYGGYESVTKIAEKFGYGEEQYDPSYGAFVAELGPMYESANSDWTQQGYAGMPAYGIGNLNYLQSISNAFGTDPYYAYIAQMQNQMQTRSA